MRLNIFKFSMCTSQFICQQSANIDCKWFHRVETSYINNYVINAAQTSYIKSNNIKVRLLKGPPNKITAAKRKRPQ